MAINFFKWVREKLGEGAERVTVQETLEGEIWSISAELYVRELAFWTCVNLIGNAVSKCEFKTFSGGKESKGAEYFLWNYSPNKNQNSSAFLHKWISQLYRNNEALVIEFDGQLLVADSYEHREYAPVSYTHLLEIWRWGHERHAAREQGTDDLPGKQEGAEQPWERERPYGVKEKKAGTEMTYCEEITCRIKAAKERSGKTLQRLSEDSGLSQSTIEQYF